MVHTPKKISWNLLSFNNMYLSALCVIRKWNEYNVVYERAIINSTIYNFKLHEQVYAQM